jgi:hypothetical protein
MKRTIVLVLALAVIAAFGCVVNAPPVATPKQEPLCLEVEPANADVYVDGRLVGRASDFRQNCLQVAPGDHQVVIMRQGFTNYEQKVNVSGGRTVIRGNIGQLRGPAPNVIIVREPPPVQPPPQQAPKQKPGWGNKGYGPPGQLEGKLKPEKQGERKKVQPAYQGQGQGQQPPPGQFKDYKLKPEGQGQQPPPGQFKDKGKQEGQGQGQGQPHDKDKDKDKDKNKDKDKDKGKK